MGIGRAAPAHGAGGHGQPRPATISLTVAASAYGVRRSLGYLIGLIVLWLADHIATAPPPAARTATAWLIAGACLASMLRDPARARIINTALAAALVGATTLAALR
jgi:hypothetical protein